MYHSYTALCSDGITQTEARALVLDQLRISRQDIEALNDVHEAMTSKVVGKLPSPVAYFIKDYSGVVPLVIFAIYSVKEFPMIEFLREGGLPGVLAILALGAIALTIDLRHFFKWFILRDHSAVSLNSFNNGPLYLAAAAFLAGIFTVAAGYRLVFAKWSERAVPEAVIRAGLSEPLAGIMVAAVMAGLIVLLHGWLATWRTQTLGERI